MGEQTTNLIMSDQTASVIICLIFFSFCAFVFWLGMTIEQFKINREKRKRELK